MTGEFAYMVMGGSHAYVPSYWLFLLPGLLLGIYAQMRLSSSYAKYSQQSLAIGISGAEAARTILDRAGLNNMPVEMVRGHLTDHYDPMKKALFLSEENYHGRSVAAVGVAAHESGHALQHQASYAPLNLRMAMVPITNFATQASFVLFFGGLFLAITKLALLAIVIYGIVTVFQLVTLPVEYDASRRAKQQLLALGIVQRNEAGAVSSVLNAAALTYVAAMVSSMLQLLYWISLFRGSDRR
jgi:Zn-dependent membrane protease YugP